MKKCFYLVKKLFKRVIFPPFITMFIFIILYIPATHYLSNLALSSYEKALSANFKVLEHSYRKDFFRVYISSKFAYRNNTFRVDSTMPNSAFSFLGGFDLNSSFEVLEGEVKKFFRNPKFANAKFHIKEGRLNFANITIEPLNFKNNIMFLRSSLLNVNLDFEDNLLSSYKITSDKAKFFRYSTNLGVSLEHIVYEATLLKPSMMQDMGDLSNFSIYAKNINSSIKFNKTYNLHAKSLQTNIAISDDKLHVKNISIIDDMSLKPKNRVVNPLYLRYGVEITSKDKDFYIEFINSLLNYKNKFYSLNLVTNDVSQILVDSLVFRDTAGRDFKLDANLSVDNSVNLEHILNYLNAKGNIIFDKKYLDAFIYDAIVKKALLDSGLLIDTTSNFKISFIYNKDINDIFINQDISFGNLIYGEKFNGFDEILNFN